MKNITSFLVLPILWLSIFSLTLTSCDGYDDTSILESITEIENRVAILEDLCESLNSDIKSLQDITNALQNNDYVTSITPIISNNEEVGYSINFSQSGTVTITNGVDGIDGVDGVDGVNGVDGITPIISAALYFDDLYYWTVNGEWLLDNSGNMIRTTGDDGYTPVIDIAEYNGLNYWTLDDQWLLDNSGNKIPTTGADGQDGQDGKDGVDGSDGSDGSTSTSIFSYVYYDDISITFVLSGGTIISIPYINDGLVSISGASSVIEYNASSGSLVLPFSCNMNLCSSIIAKVTNTIYSSVDIYTKVASTDNNWGVTINQTALTVTLVAPSGSSIGDTALLELIAISNSGVTYTSSAVIEVVSNTGIPSASDNMKEPTLSDSDITVPTLPSATFTSYESDGIMTVSMTGIQSLVNSTDFVKLYGTGSTNQNVWLYVDDSLVGFTVSNGEETRSLTTVAKADLVFLVDNSGSMSQEANTVATQLVSWSEELAKVMDVNFGCVGYAETAISGAIDLTDVSTVSTYLNRTTGTSRTKGYADNVSSAASSAASSYASTGECGAMAAKFADTYFTFRDGANRIYVNLTDEPNHYSTSHYEWSVEAFNPNAVSPYSYSWSNSKGTVHTVMSDDGYYDTRHSTYKENPALMSTYTGGTSMLGVDSSYSGINLQDLPVTGAIINSYLFKLNYTPSLSTGTHVLTLLIYDPASNVYVKYDFNIVF
ncbi:MAG: PL29 family lyase N-terminal domain-containing protein [Rikenellaceae bacterium]